MNSDDSSVPPVPDYSSTGSSTNAASNSRKRSRKRLSDLVTLPAPQTTSEFIAMKLEQSSTRETSSEPFLPPPPPRPDCEDLTKAVSQQIVDNIDRLNALAGAVEKTINPATMSPSEFTRTVRTAAYLRKEAIVAGTRVIDDVMGSLRKRKETKDA